ncbi:hypothetical protein B0H11DRAFT_1911178 [Mycena galericulata]|nr:hypothetical protein B0H11DRAFT_1923365 [Mycena galericulata]KAJ7493251.1 hypothetical protein B0H11DRAFT_1911178 [Mycena galericulata]
MTSQHYDDAAAGRALDEAIKKSIQEYVDGEDAAVQHLNSLNVEPLTVQITGTNRKIWRVGPATKEGQVEDELVFRFQGILSRFSLVPVQIKDQQPNKVATASQQVTLIGCGSEQFEAGLLNTRELHALYTRYFQGDVTKLPGTNGAGVLVLSASNRFLTSLQDEPYAVNIKFGSGVDPLGHLQTFVGSGLVHTIDNVVDYYRANTDDATGKTVYDTAFPANFRVGDLVEIQASAIAFQGKNQSMKLHCHLRALTLIDSQFSKKAESARMKEVQAKAPPVVTLRRKVGYTDELSDQPAAKRANQSTG